MDKNELKNNSAICYPTSDILNDELMFSLITKFWYNLLPFLAPCSESVKRKAK